MMRLIYGACRSSDALHPYTHLIEWEIYRELES
jgi:hypothetical protein